jgi:hypothetical protein
VRQIQARFQRATGSGPIARICRLTRFFRKGRPTARRGARLSANAVGLCAAAVLSSSCGKTLVVDTTSSLPCTTGAPDVGPETARFDVDTGLSPLVTRFGSMYGSASCPGQFLVEVDLTAPALNNGAFVVVGQWTDALISSSCPPLQATMDVYGQAADSSSWELYDRVTYANARPGECNPTSVSHSDASQDGLEGTTVPAGTFEVLRVAISATEGAGSSARPVAVNVFGRTAMP